MTDEQTPLLDNVCVKLLAPNPNYSKTTKNKLLLATFIAILFFITELIAGYFANSLALMSDAFHLLTDVASFIVALVAIYLAEKPPTKTHTYGFHRAEVIAALLSVLTIWILTGFLLMEAVERIESPRTINAKLMCITASIGVFVNIILAVVLGGHHHHDHEHWHSDEELNERHKAGSNINLRAAALHVIGDLVASIGVLMSALILMFKPEYTFIDPLCTFIFSIVVIITTFYLIKDALAVLMEGAPEHIEAELIENSLLQIPGVVAVHDLHVWELSPGKSALTVHITAFNDSNHHNDIISQGQKIILDVFGVQHSTLQIEPVQPKFTSHCRPHICQQ